MALSVVPKGQALDAPTLERFRALVAEKGEYEVLAAVGCDRQTFARALAGLTVHAGTRALIKQQLPVSPPASHAEITPGQAQGMGFDLPGVVDSHAGRLSEDLQHHSAYHAELTAKASAAQRDLDEAIAAGASNVEELRWRAQFLAGCVRRAAREIANVEAMLRAIERFRWAPPKSRPGPPAPAKVPAVAPGRTQARSRAPRRPAAKRAKNSAPDDPSSPGEPPSPPSPPASVGGGA